MLRVRFVSALSCRVGGGFGRLPFLQYISTFRTDLTRWQRRCERLTQLQLRIYFPKVETITVQGQDVTLPLGSVEAMCTPSPAELEYLVGFFDGDGSASMNKWTGQLHLSISQSLNSVEVLMHFRSLLGGSISHHSASTGSKKAMVLWRGSMVPR